MSSSDDDAYEPYDDADVDALAAVEGDAAAVAPPLHTAPAPPASFTAYEDEADLLRGAGAAHDDDEDDASSDTDDGGDNTGGVFGTPAAAAAAVAAIEAGGGHGVDFGDAGASSDSDDGGRGRAAAPPRKRARAGAPAAAPFGATAAAIFAGPAPGARRRARVRERRRARAAERGARARDLPPAAAARVADAHLAVVAGDLPRAAALLKEAVRLAPNYPDAYETLGSVAADAGDSVRAMNYLMIAAHMAGDGAKWRRLAKLSADHGMLRQAIYCLTKLLARARGDLDAQWDRAVLYAQVGEPRAALRGFAKLARARPADGDVAKWVARMHHALKDSAAAAGALEALLRDHPASADLTHVNMLAELRLSTGDTVGAATLIEDARVRWAGGGGLPADLEVKGAAAAATLGDVTTARATLDACLAGPDAPPDMLEAGGDVLRSAGDAQAAVGLYVRAAACAPPASAPAVWARLAAAAREVGGAAGEADACRALLADATAAPGVHSAAALRLAELCVADGNADDARALMPRIDALTDAAGADPTDTARAADVLLALGDVDGFLAAATPLACAALDAADAAADLRTRLEPGVRKALARRAGRGGGGVGGGGGGVGPSAVAPAAVAPPPSSADGDAAAVFKGYEGRDRRKPHVRQADEAAAGLVASDTGAAAAVAAAAAAAAARGEPLDAAGFRVSARVAQALLDAGRPDEAATLVARLSRHARRGRRADDKADALALLAARAALARGGAAAGADAAAGLRDVCGRRPRCNAAWNTYAAAAAAAGAARGAPRWLASAVDGAAPPPLPPLVLLGAAHACGGDPARGAAELAAARAAAPDEPLPALCLAVALATLATARAAAAPPDRERAAAAALAHAADYARLRGRPAEAAYNLGRVCHALGLPAAAAGLYARALEASSKKGGNAGAVAPEAAHNLSLLLRASGADGAARRVLRRWAVV